MQVTIVINLPHLLLLLRVQIKTPPSTWSRGRVPAARIDESLGERNFQASPSLLLTQYLPGTYPTVKEKKTSCLPPWCSPSRRVFLSLPFYRCKLASFYCSRSEVPHRQVISSKQDAVACFSSFGRQRCQDNFLLGWRCFGPPANNKRQLGSASLAGERDDEEFPQKTPTRGEALAGRR